MIERDELVDLTNKLHKHIIDFAIENKLNDGLILTAVGSWIGCAMMAIENEERCRSFLNLIIKTFEAGYKKEY